MMIIQAVKKYTNKAGEEKSFNTQIGTAFTNKDGSMTLKFDYFPTNHEAWLILRERTDKPNGNKPPEDDVGF